MYCNIVSKRSETKPPHYTDCLTEGIAELSAMLNVRKRPTEEAESRDESTRFLLEKGMSIAF